MSQAASATYENAGLEKMELLPGVKDWKDKGYRILVVNLPMTGEWVYKRFMESLMAMCAGDAYMYFLSDKIKIFINICGDFPIDHNRNKSVRVALEKFGADYIMQLDTDQTFHAGTIMRLWESMHKSAPDGTEPEVVAGMYFMKNPPFRPVLGPYTGWEAGMDLDYLDRFGFVCRGECGDAKHVAGAHQLVRWSGPHYWPEDKLFRTDVIGVGCVLSRASMWRKLTYPFFRYSPDPLRGSKNGDAPEISEDMFWCANMHRAGVKVWIEPKVQCGHIGILEANRELYLGGFQSTLKVIEALPEGDATKKKFKEGIVDVR